MYSRIEISHLIFNIIVVHGYKFNIFFPDLIDTSVTPRYFLEQADEKEFAILRFHSGTNHSQIYYDYWT